MQKAGERLKTVRQEKGYSLEEVSKKTKISTSILRALEEGRLDNINPVYLRGFLKLYCRFLGLDWESFVKEYSLTSSPKAAAPKSTSNPKETEPQRAPKESFSAFLFIKKNKRIIKIIISAIVALLLVVVFLKGFLFLIKRLPKVRPLKKQSQQTTPKKAHPAAVRAAEKPQGTPPQKVVKNVSAQSAASAHKEPVSRTIVLVIRAKEDSFLKVKVDGQMVYQSALRKGKAETWTAKDKIELSVGNAGGLVLEINGKIFSSLGRSGQSIKNILITSEGLKIL